MVRHGFTCRHTPHEVRIDYRSAGATRRCMAWRDDADLGECLHCKQLDLEPQPKARFLGKDDGHLRH